MLVTVGPLSFVTVGLEEGGSVTKLSHGGARILDDKIWGRRTNLNHTRPHTQSLGGESTELWYSGARILYILLTYRYRKE